MDYNGFIQFPSYINNVICITSRFIDRIVTHMRRNTIFFLIIILSFNIPLIYSATNEGYGEDETSLGQFVDSFENSNNVSVMVDVINNQTLDCMELNYTSAQEVTNDTFQLREHKNYADYNPFYTFTIYGGEELHTDSTQGNLGYGYNFFYGDKRWLDGKYIRFRWKYYASAGVYPMYFKIEDGKYDRSNNTDFPTGSPYPAKGAGNLYSTQHTSGSNVWVTKDVLINLGSSILDDVSFFWWCVDAWSDVDVGIRLDWIEINENSGGANNIWRMDFNVAETVVMEVTGTTGDYGYVNNSGLPIITGGYRKEGYFTSTDYLDDPLANGTTLVYMANATVPSSTTMTVEFSQDESTWVDNQGVSGYNNIPEGMTSFDLRDLNYSTGFHIRINMTTSWFDKTPRLFQSRLITTIGNVTVIGNGDGEIVYKYPSEPVIMLIFLCVIGSMILLGVRKR